MKNTEKLVYPSILSIIQSHWPTTDQTVKLAWLENENKSALKISTCSKGLDLNKSITYSFKTEGERTSWQQAIKDIEQNLKGKEITLGDLLALPPGNNENGKVHITEYFLGPCLLLVDGCMLLGGTPKAIEPLAEEIRKTTKADVKLLTEVDSPLIQSIISLKKGK